MIYLLTFLVLEYHIDKVRVQIDDQFLFLNRAFRLVVRSLFVFQAATVIGLNKSRGLF